MSSRSVHGYSEALPDRQALATILQTLKKHNLKVRDKNYAKLILMHALYLHVCSGCLCVTLAFLCTPVLS